MRIFAGEWVKNMLTRLGMQEGEAIESRMVSRRIEGAQKKVEERNFEVRKNLLEYDEVMDEQRKRVYSYRQRILDGANCRDLIIEMIDREVDEAFKRFLAPTYGAEIVRRGRGQFAARPARCQGLSQLRIQRRRATWPSTKPAAWPSRRFSTRSKRTCPKAKTKANGIGTRLATPPTRAGI